MSPPNSDDTNLAGSEGIISRHPASDTADPEMDRRAIRRARAPAAKLAKKMVSERFEEILRRRPVGSQPADKVLARAVALYSDGPLQRRDLKRAQARLEAAIRTDVPDLVIIRSPRTVSAKPQRVGLMIYETRAIVIDGDKLVSAVNHSVVLAEDGVIFVSGLLPGGTRPHLFERAFERNVTHRSMAPVQMNLSTLWPTLLWMRNEQRRSGRGKPLDVIITPYEKGLLFGTFFKVEGAPPGGPIVSIVSTDGQQSRKLRDQYGNQTGDRVWAMTNTYVDQELLSGDQRRLAATLRSFAEEYDDVVSENEWRWRFGLGESDPAVTAVVELFGLTPAPAARRAAANSALETILSSQDWTTVADRTLKSQAKARKPAVQT